MSSRDQAKGSDGGASNSEEEESLRLYLLCIRRTLEAALCLQPFPCQDVERYSKPEVEFRTSPELLLQPVTISRSSDERCFIEGSINAVRVSIKVSHDDPMSSHLASTYLTFLSTRAEEALILRRKPVEGYDLSFLVTAEHCLRLSKAHVLDFIVRFIQDLSHDITDMRSTVTEASQVAAQHYLKQFEL